jgi:hypothetical protein
VNPPPIPNLASHIGVDWSVTPEVSGSPATGWQVDWVHADVRVRRGSDWRGTWMATNELVSALAAPAPRFRLKGRRLLIDLLNHEQGHFDITALLVRDHYNAVLALIEPKPTIFKTQQELQYRLQDLQTETQALEATLRGNFSPGMEYDGLYDEETRHGRDMQKQAHWDAILRHAWSKKMPLRELLRILKKKI